jgi:hypothetical protein
MRVVICQDDGVPAELMRDAVAVGQALMERDCEVDFIVGDPVSLINQSGSWVPRELYPAPMLKPIPELVMKRAPADGFADHMAIAGFENKQNLITIATMWHRLLSLLKPDIIIGFRTPVLWLIAPHIAPTVAIGNGMTLPPVLGPSFPRLTPDSVPLADENIMLENANSVLARLGFPPLAQLSECLSLCNPILYGLPAFDPYLQLRSTITAGLLGQVATPTNPPTEERLAVFLDVYCPGIETIILALAGFNQVPSDIYISGAPASMQRYLEQQPNITMWADHEDLLKHAATASAVIHHGVQDVAQRCISLGRPHLIIPWTREQEILSYMIGWMSMTKVHAPNTPIDQMAEAFRDLLRDSSLMVAAQHHARQLFNANLPDALPIIVSKIEEISGKTSSENTNKD